MRTKNHDKVVIEEISIFTPGPAASATVYSVYLGPWPLPTAARTRTRGGGTAHDPAIGAT